jgi:hypothetical protein
LSSSSSTSAQSSSGNSSFSSSGWKFNLRSSKICPSISPDQCIDTSVAHRRKFYHPSFQTLDTLFADAFQSAQLLAWLRTYQLGTASGGAKHISPKPMPKLSSMLETVMKDIFPKDLIDDMTSFYYLPPAKCFQWCYLPILEEITSKLPIDVSKYGGRPYLMSNEVWPKCKKCLQPLTFQFQIRLADFPEPLQEIHALDRYSILSQLFQFFVCDRMCALAYVSNSVSGFLNKSCAPEDSFLARIIPYNDVDLTSQENRHMEVPVSRFNRVTNSALVGWKGKYIIIIQILNLCRNCWV